jgi:hypothetical protein
MHIYFVNRKLYNISTQHWKSMKNENLFSINFCKNHVKEKVGFGTILLDWPKFAKNNLILIQQNYIPNIIL